MDCHFCSRDLSSHGQRARKNDTLARQQAVPPVSFIDVCPSCVFAENLLPRQKALCEKRTHFFSTAATTKKEKNQPWTTTKHK
jgi:hypothetical protein